VHAVWDNLTTHRAQAVWQAFNARRGRRFHFHFTPLDASWVNQIELWFARYTRRVLRHASHTSTAHLRERTGQSVGAHNQAACPFKWSFRGYPQQGGAS
jgi:transposase